MKPELRYAAAAVLVVLSACGESKKQASQGTAGGQILEGSVSDAMLPIDRVSSQPPLAPKSEGSGKPGGKSGGKGDRGGAAATGDAPANDSGADDAPAPAGGGDAPPAPKQDGE